MVEKMVSKIVNQMEMQKIINKSNCEYYEYALIIMAENIITVGTMLLLGLLFKQFLHIVCFLVFFLSLRKRTGGFHADKFCQCYLETIVTYAAIIQVTSIFCRNPAVMYGMLFPAVIIIWIMGTINHPNMNMNKSELQESKKAARLLVLMELMIIAVLAYLVKKKEKIGKAALKAVERIARNEAEKVKDRYPPICLGITHQPKRPKKKDD